jgi:hypothetical protein
MQWRLKAVFITFLCVIAVLGFTSNAQAQSEARQSTEDLAPLIGNVGRGVFSLTSDTFNCRAFIKSVKNLPVLHIAVLYNTFGNNYACWDQLASDPRLQTVELNLINEPGHRNKRLGSYEFLYGLGTPANYDKLLRNKDPELKKKFDDYVQLAKQKIDALPKHVQCLINPGLESNVSSKAGKTLIEWTREHFPNCRTVWNPLRGFNEKSRKVTGADLVEGHGSGPNIKSPCIVNLDGTDIDFPQRPSAFQKGGYVESGRPLMQYISTYANRCEVVFLWVLEDNCNFSKSFIDPRKRNCKAADKVFPLVAREAEKAMKSIRQYNPKSWTSEEKKSLSSCSEVRSSSDGDKRGFLLKQSEFRERGGVVLIPKGTQASRVDIVSKGRVIDSYQRSGAYNHDGSNRPMYRSKTSPITYPFHVVVRLPGQAGNVCYPIDNPNTRND